jgi:carbon-monoxide dehydrogenase large subunit
MFKSVGQPVRRKEDARLLTGRGQFTDDFNLPGQAWMAAVRSPHPHAQIKSIDPSMALGMPGVLAVYSGSDLAPDGMGQIPHNPVPSTQFDVKLRDRTGGPVYIGEHYLLPTDRARYVGEAIAIVIAETRAQAYIAAENVLVDYDILPWVAEASIAALPGAPRLWDALPDDVLVDSSFGDKENTDVAFSRAKHIVSMRYHLGRVTGVPLEPRAALGNYDSGDGRFTLYAGSGGAVRQKHELASVLGVAPDRVRVLSLDVGGNFGTRNRAFVEFGLVLYASKKIGRPVKYRAERTESFLTDYQGRDLTVEASLALDENGKFLAMRSDNLSNVGARCVSLSPLSKGSGLITGSYDIPYATLRSRAVYTNTMPTQAYRSSGRPEVCFVIEYLVDKAARTLGFDRVELRRRNLVKTSQMPYRNAVGSTYDSGEYEKNMDRLLQISDFEGAKIRKAQALARGRLYGKERCDLIVRSDDIELVIGTQPAGQGHETSFAQVTADLLGVTSDQVRVTLGDTDVVSAGGGTHSGRSMRHASAVISLAAPELIVKGKSLAAHLLDVPVDQVEFSDGLFRHATTNRTLHWFELGRQAEVLFPEGLKVRRDNEMHTPVFPNGTCMCEIDIDPETGALEIVRYSTIDDVGRCINPMIVHGQTHGGIAQGVGQALWEGCVNDPNTGQPLAVAFTEYGMPRFDNMPFFKTEIAEVLSPTNPLGIKAGGEGGTTPALAVMMSAVQDALAAYGSPDIAMPFTPLRLWTAIQDGKSRLTKSAA